MSDSETVVADPAVLAAWQSGPRWFHVVVAMIHDDDVEARRLEIAGLLGEDLVAVAAPRQPHVTIWAAGFEPDLNLPDGGTIPLQVGGPDSFASAAYLQVSGPGVQRVRSRMTADGFPEVREAPFVPHVTVGTYLRRVPMSEVHARLTEWADPGPIPVTGHIRHLVVDTRSSVGALVEPPAAGGR